MPKLISVQSNADKIITFTRLDDDSLRINFKQISDKHQKLMPAGTHWPVKHREDEAIAFAEKWLTGAYDQKS